MAGSYATKQKYVNALLDMCETQQLSSITVVALCKQAKTAHQTFYNNFRDINDLISYVSIECLAHSGMPLDRREVLSYALAFAQEHPGFFCQMVQYDGQNNYRDSMMGWLEASCFASFVPNDLSERDRMVVTLQIKAICAAMVEPILVWLRSGMEIPADVVLDALSTEILPRSASSRFMPCPF